HVTQGQRLLTFDIDLIKSQGLIVETPVIVTNQDSYQVASNQVMTY
ncbi:MAG: PTS glucose transporter subunit IIA, partial [Pseudolactococcus laudensis]